jgi:hypothetical protein
MRMSMHRMDRRVQILLDEPRYRRLTDEARRRGVSVAAVIRDALDRLPTDADLRRTAIDEILSAEPMPVPDRPSELRRELDAAHEGTA